MAKMDLNGDDEKVNIETIFSSAMDMLSDDDKKLPQASCCCLFVCIFFFFWLVCMSARYILFGYYTQELDESNCWPVGCKLG